MSINPPAGGTDDPPGVEFGFSLTPVGHAPIMGLPGGAAPPPQAPQSTAQATVSPPLMNPPASRALARAAEAAHAAAAFHRAGRYRDAMVQYREAVRLDPAHPDYHAALALCAWQAGEMGIVEHHLSEALRLDPENVAAHQNAGQWYLAAGDLGRALLHSGRAAELSPHDTDVAASHAFVLEGGGQQDAAWRVVEPLVASAVAAGRVRELSRRLVMAYGRLAPQFNRVPEALDVVTRVLDAPAAGGASGADTAERAPLRFTAVALLERLGRYDEAFAQARAGKAETRRPYDPALNAQRVDRRIGYFTPARLHDLPRASHRSRRPVFIVGMPRSGTSLVEQVLASHPQVYGGGELMKLIEIARGASRADWAEGEDYPDYLDSLSVRKADRMARDYLAALDAMDPDAAYVTDKMPHNFMYLGLVALLFPDCHVIHCTRDPLDTCLSCYTTHFAAGHEFTHDLRHLGLFYRDYERLMAHWETVVNFPMIEMRYEAVVADLEGQARRLLGFLDLPWDERCLGFHRTHRAVATASTAQVRRPIYASSVGRWRKYEKHLGELIEALGPAKPR